MGSLGEGWEAGAILTYHAAKFNEEVRSVPMKKIHVTSTRRVRDPEKAKRAPPPRSQRDSNPAARSVRDASQHQSAPAPSAS